MPKLTPIVAGLLLVVSVFQTATAGPNGRWMGQDGHDLVGQFAAPGKSDVQDLHFALSDLPPRERIVGTTVQADGGGLWKADGAASSWLALVVRQAGSTTADLYIEPYQVETGRRFFIELKFESGQTVTVVVPGGRADPNLRTASARMEARWIGQDGTDRATSSPNVGPDGVQDVHIVLKRLAPRDEIRSVVIVGPGDCRWQSGANPEGHHGAELVRSPADPTTADLYFHPTRDLRGLTLKIHLTYASGKLDAANLVGGPTDATLKVKPTPKPLLTFATARATWLGQTEPGGDVHVRLEGLNETGRVVASSLGDAEAGWWADRTVAGTPEALPLRLVRGRSPGTAVLSFPPVRDESGATMTLRLAFENGRSAIVEFAGGACDPSLRAARPIASSATARPGDDLQTLVDQNGAVVLAAGRYVLSKPLVLSRPVTLRSEAGATLVFAQGSGEPAWTAAIKIHSGGTTLDRLAIRFAGPVRWDREVNFGPAVIGTTDNRDRSNAATLAGLTFTRLDIESPPASTEWEEAPKTLRLIGATNGRIEGNVIKGGMVEFSGGPWRFVDNRHDGTPARTFTYSVLSAHDPHDMLISGNTVRSVDPSGKTWRWLVMTTSGANIRVAGNTIEGVGPRDSDKVAHPNSPETILTESYRVHFEGKTAAVSDDGRVLTIPRAQGEPAGVGAIVSILSGPEAGTWRRVALPLGGESYLLDRAVRLGGGAVSIERGFTGTTFEDNAIDDRGSGVCIPFVLAGNHFGTKVAGNRTLGGDVSFLIAAAATEAPVHWGWSHNPMFGLRIERNTFGESRNGATLAVEHNHLTRATRGRVYFTATLADNTFVRPDAAIAVTIGAKGDGEPGEIAVNEVGNRRESGRSAPSLRVLNAKINGRAIRDASLSFPTSGEASAVRSPSRPR